MMKKIPKFKIDEEVARFWETHKFKDTALVSKSFLKKDWLRPEEDEAWQNS